MPDVAEGGIKNNDLYNDKELIDDGDLGWYDYGFRSYDAQIGRFMQMDPITDNYSSWSPYIYAGNEPIANIDFMGMGPETGLTAATAKLLPGVIVSSGSRAAVSATRAAVSGVLSIGKSLVINGVSSILNSQTNSVNPPNNPYWILYDGQKVSVYKGDYGDKSNLYLQYGGTSGATDYQNSGYSDAEDKEPVPSGEYKVNLEKDPRRQTKRPLSANTGVELLSNAKDGWTGGQAWGRWRARIEKVNVTSKRDNMYFHDSYKGYSHGCVETETPLYYFLVSLHDKGVKSIRVQVKYPATMTYTNGGTKNLKFSLPKNIAGLVKQQISPPTAIGIPYPFIPIPPQGYNFEKIVKFY